MNALLVRVGADQTKAGGGCNGPVDSRTGEFAYVPILETGDFQTGMATPYSMVSPSLQPFRFSLPGRLSLANMHLDPDFRYLTYGDSNQRASQIKTTLTKNDLIVFYAGMRDVHPTPRLVYALIGLYVIETILPASSVPSSQHHENAHTRLVNRRSFLEPGGATTICIHLPLKRVEGQRLHYRILQQVGSPDRTENSPLKLSSVSFSAQSLYTEGASFPGIVLHRRPSLVSNATNP